MLLILAGCASQPRLNLPDWGDLALPTEEITDPIALPLLCEMQILEGTDGIRYGTWTPDCWKEFMAYEIISEANTDIAGANASALRNTEAGYGTLIKVGELQQILLQHYADLLEEERSGRFIDSLLYRALIGLGLLVVIL